MLREFQQGAEVLRFALKKEENEMDVLKMARGIYFVKVGDSMTKVLIE